MEVAPIEDIVVLGKLRVKGLGLTDGKVCLKKFWLELESGRSRIPVDHFAVLLTVGSLQLLNPGLLLLHLLLHNAKRGVDIGIDIRGR